MKKYLMVFLFVLTVMTLFTQPLTLAEAIDPLPMLPGIDLTPCSRRRLPSGCACDL